MSTLRRPRLGSSKCDRGLLALPGLRSCHGQFACGRTGAFSAQRSEADKEAEKAAKNIKAAKETRNAKKTAKEADKAAKKAAKEAEKAAKKAAKEAEKAPATMTITGPVRRRAWGRWGRRRAAGPDCGGAGGGPTAGDSGGGGTEGHNTGGPTRSTGNADDGQSSTVSNPGCTEGCSSRRTSPQRPGRFDPRGRGGGGKTRGREPSPQLLGILGTGERRKLRSTRPVRSDAARPAHRPRRRADGASRPAELQLVEASCQPPRESGPFPAPRRLANSGVSITTI